MVQGWWQGCAREVCAQYSVRAPAWLTPLGPRRRRASHALPPQHCQHPRRHPWRRCGPHLQQQRKLGDDVLRRAALLLLAQPVVGLDDLAQLVRQVVLGAAGEGRGWGALGERYLLGACKCPGRSPKQAQSQPALQQQHSSTPYSAPYSPPAAHPPRARVHLHAGPHGGRRHGQHAEDHPVWAGVAGVKAQRAAVVIADALQDLGRLLGRDLLQQG